ncbi:MAG: EpsG family protein, partial [Pantoea sp.]|uniref:EpsG family protein n=1 Tax=Pantoea sp. TaxID=69393 RepID=UPI0023A2C38B
MLPYLIVTFFCVLFVYVQDKTLKSRAVILPLATLTFLAAIRDYTVGTDAKVYTRDFRFPFNHYPLTLNPDVEKGYQLLAMLVRGIYNEYYFYFMIMALVCIFPVLMVLKKRSQNYSMSLYIYITFGMYFALYNQVRQAIAMGICLFALKYLVEKKTLKYALFILVACQFHVSAAVMLVFYFLSNANFRVEFKVVLTFLIGVIATPLIVAQMAAGNARYEHYTEEATNGRNGLMTVLLYVVIAIAIYILGKKIRYVDREYSVMECSYLCGIAALLPVAMLGTDPAGPQRVAQYFVYYLMLLIPIILKKVNNKLVSAIFCVCALSYFVMMIMSNIAGIYP